MGKTTQEKIKYFLLVLGGVLCFVATLIVMVFHLLHLLLYKNDMEVFVGWQIPVVYTVWLVLILFILYCAKHKRYFVAFSVWVVFMLSSYGVFYLHDFATLSDRMAGIDHNYYKAGTYSYVNKDWCLDKYGSWDADASVCYFGR